MIIRNGRELSLLEEIIRKCRKTVWLRTACGKQYDLKNPVERCLGFAEMLKPQAVDELELFTNSYENEMLLFEFIATQKAHDNILSAG